MSSANFSGDMFGRGPLARSSVPKSVEEEPNSGTSTEVKQVLSIEKKLSQFYLRQQNKTEEFGWTDELQSSSQTTHSIKVKTGPALGVAIPRDNANISDQGMQRNSLMNDQQEYIGTRY